MSDGAKQFLVSVSGVALGVFIGYVAGNLTTDALHMHVLGRAHAGSDAHVTAGTVPAVAPAAAKA